jgi:hypothetical protein
MYKSTNVVAFKEDPDGVEARVRWFNINELVKVEDGTWRCPDMRAFMDPLPEGKEVGRQDRDRIGNRLRGRRPSSHAILRDMFERFGPVTRVFSAKDRETGLAEGLAS